MLFVYDCIRAGFDIGIVYFSESFAQGHLSSATLGVALMGGQSRVALALQHRAICDV
jgi:hypothetical protein